MTDIVQQLHQRDGDWLCEKAADEIERLRRQIQSLEIDARLWREMAKDFSRDITDEQSRKARDHD